MPGEDHEPMLDATESLVSALGLSGARISILRVLRCRPGAPVSVIAASMGQSRHGLARHLRLLEDARLIRSRIQRVAHSDRPARCYFLDEQRVEDAAWSLFDRMTGTGGEYDPSATRSDSVAARDYPQPPESQLGKPIHPMISPPCAIVSEWP